jgi:hypothetical protein
MDGNIKELVNNFVNTLHQYDYYAFYWLGALAFISIIFALIVQKKQTLSGLLLLTAILSIFVGPFVSYFKVHNYLYGTDIELTYVKKMQFADVLLIRGKITAKGEEDITKCRLHTFVTPRQEGVMRDLQSLFVLNPLKRKVEVLEKELKKGESSTFKIKFKNFKTSKDVNSSDIYIYPECFKEK